MMVPLKTESRKAKEWRERMERFTVSGLQVEVFCQTEGVSEAMFYRWRQRLVAGEAGGAVQTTLHVFNTDSVEPV